MASVPVFLLLTLVATAVAAPAWYDQQRLQMLATEAAERTGGHLALSAKEKAVSDVMTAEKSRVIHAARVNNSVFPPAMSFFQAKKYIDQSLVYKVIREMPKGGVLHIHDTASASLDWVIQNLTYRDNLYRGFDHLGDMLLEFFDSPPADDSITWELVKNLRACSGDAALFDEGLYKNLSIVVDNPEDVYPTINLVWQKFTKYFKAMGMLKNPAVRKDYLRRALEEFMEDNVQYIEFRIGNTALNPPNQPPGSGINLYREVMTEFMADHPDFIGVKVILASNRFSSQDTILTQVQEALQLSLNHSDIFLGFDLVAQEDLGNTYYHYLNQLLYAESKSEVLPYYFHAGETDWQGNIDLNLVDAVLLNSTRIGHGFALLKHPEVLRISKERGIAIEVNPISNQVLGLVGDLRNHPAAALLADNHPVVISSDDPPVWDASPLSHDFYVTFMALTSELDDLRVLKQLAKNSILYSGMRHAEKIAALAKWELSWDKFIQNAFETYVLKQAPFG